MQVNDILIPAGKAVAAGFRTRTLEQSQLHADFQFSMLDMRF